MTATNKDRAERAAAALRHHQSFTGSLDEDSLGDLLCDLHHWCDRENGNFESALDRARQHYDAESSITPTTPYMAVFNTPAGTASEIFHANSPEEALERARKFADDPQLTEVDIEPLADGSGYCVREITISDERGQQHSLWQTDEYRLQLAAPKLLQAIEKQLEITREIIHAWNNTDKLQGAVQDLIYAFESQSECARDVLDTWENGDLAGAVNGLEESLTFALEAIAQAKGGAA
ncbi:MAG: hypothetical protein ABSD61_06060 [Terracidiphilus sp.]|jgi:hypothetical protein